MIRTCLTISASRYKINSLRKWKQLANKFDLVVLYPLHCTLLLRAVRLCAYLFWTSSDVYCALHYDKRAAFRLIVTKKCIIGDTLAGPRSLSSCSLLPKMHAQLVTHASICYIDLATVTDASRWQPAFILNFMALVVASALVVCSFAVLLSILAERTCAQLLLPIHARTLVVG